MNSHRSARSDCNKRIIKREHYCQKDGMWKPKKSFDSEEEAMRWIKKYKMYGYKTYLCKICGKIHIGKKK